MNKDEATSKFISETVVAYGQLFDQCLREAVSFAAGERQQTTLSTALCLAS